MFLRLSRNKLVKFILSDAFYFDFAGFSKNSDTGYDRRVASTIVFEWCAFLYIEVIEGDGEC